MLLTARSYSNNRLVVAAQQGSTPLVRGPPPDYSHRSSLKQKSGDLVSRKYPELLPLVEQGGVAFLLLALPRPSCLCVLLLAPAWQPCLGLSIAVSASQTCAYAKI